MSDPAKQPRPLSSLSEAFTCLHMPFENRRIVEAYTRAIGITTYLERSSYVIANRRDGGPALRIGYGWADGFIDANEIRSILGASLDTWQSDERAPLWGLWHPINKARTGTAHSNRQRASADPNACAHTPVLGLPCDEPATAEVDGARLCKRHAAAARVDQRINALLKNEPES